ncbi:uncharacterized protein LOC116843706 isoform X2 [Odontomachus brunneus]|uniref:uncharacterized protein LOC116843706 isoform X2 n=1 Tax=Odontomachus brunneus TaxID=486640 RepID=UPI0013F23EF6|nr:uncharacterized protein LOC116843706 isoform X2 [Odontomachus brunneus]
MLLTKITLLFGLATLLKLSAAAPDSAGIVEMVNGLAYGGIPYGSVSGMLAKYPGYGQDYGPHQARQLGTFGERLVIVTPNLRASRPLSIAPRPVQIYNLPAVVAPGVVGTISQIGY